MEFMAVNDSMCIFECMLGLLEDVSTVNSFLSSTFTIYYCYYFC